MFSSIFRSTVIAASIAISMSNAQAQAPLSIKIVNADANSFNVNSTLLIGKTEAMVIDAGFTRADALRIAANVLDSGKTLKTILVSQADPDYYFGVEVLKEIFPKAEVVATPAVLEKLKAKMAGKVAFWGPKMGANAPRQPIAPNALVGTTLHLDGEVIEVRGTTGILAHRPYVWVPSLKAVIGNIGVFGHLHVWTADTQSVAERAAWISQLDDMHALHPHIVVPGHMASGTITDLNTIVYTKQYLQVFEKALVSSQNSAELIETMKQAFPSAPVGLSLEIGAKVNKGEMKW